MFFDRDQSFQRSKQLAYRNQLKNQIQLKNSKLFNKNSRNQTNSNSKQETFSLVANIQIAAQARKNKQNQYYIQLRNQIQKQKQEKKRARQQKARKQREQQDKIRRQNQVMKQRYEQQLKKQGRGKGKPQNDIKNNPVQKQQNINQKFTHQQDFPAKQNNFRKRHLVKLQNQSQRINTAQSQNQQSSLTIHTASPKKSSVPYIHTYINKIENQSFNYLPQRRHMNSYFTELLGERKRFQQEASGIAELNKLFFQQKARTGRIQSRGLDGLRSLQTLLEEKGVNYMESALNKNVVNGSGSRFRGSALNF